MNYSQYHQKIVMSLTDLKRKKPKLHKKSVSVDDFIEDANNYAFGKQTVVGDDSPAKQSTQDFLKGLDKEPVIEREKIKIKIYSLSKIPNGMPGEGTQPWTFIDEISIQK